MNIEYLRFFDTVVVADHRRKLTERSYRDNIEEILKQENIIELIRNTIKEDKLLANNYNVIIDNKKRILKKDLIFCSFLLLTIFASIVFTFDFGIVGASVCFATGCLVGVIKKIGIKKYQKKINGLNYKLSVSNCELKRQRDKLKELKANKSFEKKSELPNNLIYKIDDIKTLNRVKRNLELAYLYKMKEDLLLRSIDKNKLEGYLNNIKFNNQILNEEDKNVMIGYAGEKVKVLKK